MSAPGPRKNWPDRAVLAVIVLAALALRLLYLFQISDQPLFRNLIIDQAAYDAWAQQIAGGDWLGAEVFYQDPLYPYLLAVLYALFGRSLTLVYVVQAVISAAACLPLYGLARRAFDDRRVGLVAAALWAGYKIDFFFVGQVEKTSTGVALSIMALWLLLRFLDQPRVWPAVAAGLGAGLLLLYRGNYLLVMPAVLAAAMVFSRRRADGGPRATGPALAALAAAFLLVPAATTLRNYAVSGELVVTTAQGGINLYVGNWRGNKWGAGKDPAFARRVPLHEQADFAAEARRRTGRELSAAELSRFWSAEAGREIMADPGLFAARLGRKLLLIANRHEVPDNLSYEFYRAEFSWLLRLPLPAFWLAGPMGAAGIALGLRRRRGLLLLLYLALYAATLVVTYVVSRYRMPMVPVLLLFAALALVAAFDAARRKEWRRLAVPAAAAMMAAALGFPEWRPPSFAQSHQKLGNAWAREQNWPGAIESYQRALQLDPTGAGAMIGLGQAYVATGRRAEAQGMFAAAVKAEPDNAVAHLLLARSLEGAGRQAEAQAEYQRAFALDPALQRGP